MAMEAATSLRQSRIQLLPHAVLIDGVAIDDRCFVELARKWIEAGKDPEQLVRETLEIGARVFDREQTGTMVELFRADLARSTREVDHALSKKTEQVTTEFTRKVDELFSPDNGGVTRVLQRHFSDESSVAVQHRIRKAVEDVLTDSREKLLKQFSSADGSNPLADFKNAQITMLKRLTDQQDTNLRTISEQLTAMTLELKQLQAEREKNAEVAAEHDRSTAKGRPYEESVFEAVDKLAAGRGDDCDAVGDVPGVGGKRGDVIVAVEGANGPPRGRIVFEAKNSQTSRKRALLELEEALTHREADYAIWVVPTHDKLPARTQQLRETNGDKLFVVFDPEDREQLALEVAYSLARARVLMTRGDSIGIDATALASEVERALQAIEEVRRIKSQLTVAAGGIDEARTILDTMAAGVRAHLERIETLVTG